MTCRDDENDIERAVAGRRRGPRDVARRDAESGRAERCHHGGAAAGGHTGAVSEDLNAQADRLRERTNAVTLRPSTRNPFRFSASKAPAAESSGLACGSPWSRLSFPRLRCPHR